jgi:TonB family protein
MRSLQSKWTSRVLQSKWTRKRFRIVSRAVVQATAVVIMLMAASMAHASNDRAIKSRVAPAYPELAKRMRIAGVVKLEATVDADGKVTAVKTVSGSKALSQAAEDAVSKWKYASGSGASTEDVEVTFALGQ